MAEQGGLGRVSQQLHARGRCYVQLFVSQSLCNILTNKAGGTWPEACDRSVLRSLGLGGSSPGPWLRNNWGKAPTKAGTGAGSLGEAWIVES